jgi:hypothetical protein
MRCTAEITQECLSAPYIQRGGGGSQDRHLLGKGAQQVRGQEGNQQGEVITHLSGFSFSLSKGLFWFE